MSFNNNLGAMFWSVLAAVVGVALVIAGIWLRVQTQSEFWASILPAMGVYVAALPWLERLRRKHGLPIKLPEGENPAVTLDNWHLWIRPVAFLGSFIVAAILYPMHPRALAPNRALEPTAASGLRSLAVPSSLRSSASAQRER